MKDHKLAAIVFTDIVGYTRRMESDEEGTMKLLARQREIVFPMVKDFGGEVIKEIGDGLMMMFTSANRAVRFAIAVQNKIKDEELTIRAGIHIGDVIFEEGDVFGSAVNIAARIEPLAPAGGICISEDVRSQIRNQNDILTASIGKKELKGVNESIEIFRIVEAEYEEAQIKKPFFKDLWQRRVFQITGIYLLLSYLVRLFIDYLVLEYMLSPHLTNLIWYIMLSLIPSIILISYFHGRKGVTRWTKIELMGLTLNVLAAFLVMIFVFKGKDLGAITTTVTVQDEAGVSYKKSIPKREFRKKILIYFIENKSGDTALDYLQYGIPEMTEYDLSQDILLTPFSARYIYERIIESGHDNPADLPITLMQRFAEQRHMNYFLFGSFLKEGDAYLINIKLYNTHLTKLITEISLQNESLFDLVDQLSVAIKRELALPESHISETVDLPVSAIFTDSEKALYYYSMSLKEGVLNNWDQEILFLESALHEDPEFAIAYPVLAVAYLNMGNFEGALETLQITLDNYLHKLPERRQFIVKYINYVLRQQPEKALAIVKMWINLYPDDIVAHITLAERYAVRSMFEEAIDEHKEILRLDPEQYNSLRTLGDYYLQTGNFDSAQVYYEVYAEKFPKQAESYRRLGVFYTTIGDMDKAKENYETALLLAEASEKIRIKLNLAYVLMNAGDFDRTHTECSEALRMSRTAQDSSLVYQTLETYYLVKGQVNKSLESLESRLELNKSIYTPNEFLSQKITNLDPYIYAGKIDEAFQILEDITQEVDPPWDQVVPFGYMILYTELGEVEKAEEAIALGEQFIMSFGQEVMLVYIHEAKGELYESQDEHQLAIDSYQKYLSVNPNSIMMHCRISRCYRNLDDLKKAEEELETCLKRRPYNATVNYEAALLYLEMGDEKKGLEYLKRANDIWKDADPEYERARIAREKMKEMKKAS